MRPRPRPVASALRKIASASPTGQNKLLKGSTLHTASGFSPSSTLLAAAGGFAHNGGLRRRQPNRNKSDSAECQVVSTKLLVLLQVGHASMSAGSECLHLSECSKMNSICDVMEVYQVFSSSMAKTASTWLDRLTSMNYILAASF